MVKLYRPDVNRGVDNTQISLSAPASYGQTGASIGEGIASTSRRFGAETQASIQRYFDNEAKIQAEALSKANKQADYALDKTMAAAESTAKGMSINGQRAKQVAEDSQIIKYKQTKDGKFIPVSIFTGTFDIGTPGVKQRYRTDAAGNLIPVRSKATDLEDTVYKITDAGEVFVYGTVANVEKEAAKRRKDHEKELADAKAKDDARVLEEKLKIRKRKEEAGLKQKAMIQEMQSGLEGYIAGAGADDLENMDLYLEQGMAGLDQMLVFGAITGEQHKALSNEFKSNLFKASVKNNAKKNPDAVMELIENVPPSIALDQNDKAKMRTVVAAAYEDAKSNQKIALTEEQIQTKAAESKLKAGIEEAIATGTITATDIASYNDVLDEKTINGLLEKRRDTEMKKGEERAKLATIGQKFAAGLGAEVSEEDTQKYFAEVVKNVEMETGSSLTLEEKSRLAVSLQKPIKGIASTLASSMSSAENISLEKAQDAINAYTYITDRGADTLSDEKTFGEDEVAFYEYASTLNQEGGLSADQAFKAAHNALNTDDSTIKKLRTKFEKVKAFSDAKIEETMNDALGIEGSFGINMDIDPVVKNMFRTIAKDAFLKTGGSIEAAKKTAAKYISQTHGVSKMGGKEEYMFAPPEKVFEEMGRKVTPKALEALVSKDIQKYLPKGAENIRLISDDRTMVKGKAPTWLVEYELDGGTYILNNPYTDNFFRWGMDFKKGDK